MEKIITYENLRKFAYSNDKLINGEVKGILLYFGGLNGFKMNNSDPAQAIEYAENGIMYVIPYYNPWCWMNKSAISLTDEILDVLFAHYGLGEDTPICSNGASMGGQCALTYCVYAKRTPALCITNCPVCDLVYHYSERDDLPHTLYDAYKDFDGTMDEALRAHSPLHLVDRMPKIPYIIFHCENDQLVNLESHSVNFSEIMEKAGHSVKLVRVPHRGHCDLSPKALIEYNEYIFEGFGITGNSKRKV